MPIALNGICVNETRRISWQDPKNINLNPILTEMKLSTLDEGISIVITPIHITKEEDFQIFQYIKSGNISYALDLLDSHIGINAFDEWGQTPLMIAVQLQSYDLLSGILNARTPKADVNLAKSVFLFIIIKSL